MWETAGNCSGYVCYLHVPLYSSQTIYTHLLAQLGGRFLEHKGHTLPFFLFPLCPDGALQIEFPLLFMDYVEIKWESSVPILIDQLN